MQEEFDALSALPDSGASETALSPLLKRYQNARVTVYYHNGVSDTGWVTYFETHWIEIAKDANETLLIPSSAIRLVKLLEKPKGDSDAAMLLRASGPQNKAIE